MPIKDLIKNHKLIIFFSIIIVISIISIVSSQIYYYGLLDKTNFTIYTDVPYISLEEKINYNIKYNSLDIYVPRDAPINEKLPVMIFVHGGAWTDFFGNKSELANSLLKSIYFTDNNFIFITINYRVYPDYKFPTHVKDVSKAIKWVYDNIEDYNGNKELIFLQGHSAGAQLVSLVSTDETYLKEQALDLSVIKGSILLEGVGYDILKSREFDIDSQIINRYLMFPFGEDENIINKASSINHITKEKDIPPMIIFTAKNTVLRIAKIEALEFYLKLIDNDKYAEYYIVPFRNHSTLNRYFGEEDDFTSKKSIAFLNGIITNRIRR